MQDRLAGLLRIRWIFLGLGLVLVGGGGVATLYEALRADDVPILRSPSAIAVSDAGEIFVFSNWGRIRVFSPDGRQLRSWPVRTSRGMASLAFESPRVLAVATARNDRLMRFSPTGELLSSEHDPGALERLGTRGIEQATGPTGLTYRISGMSILRDGRGHAQVVVPGVPGLLRPFFALDLPPLAFVLHGGVVLALGAALVAQHARADGTPDPAAGQER